jgi:hypothetical protein
MLLGLWVVTPVVPTENTRYKSPKNQMNNFKNFITEINSANKIAVLTSSSSHLGYLVFPLPGMLDDQKGGNLKKDKMCISKYLPYVTCRAVFSFSTNILTGGNGHTFFCCKQSN